MKRSQPRFLVVPRPQYPMAPLLLTLIIRRALNGKKGTGNRTKATWGSWQTSGTPSHFAGAPILQAQTLPTFLGSDREAAYVAEIQQLRALVATSDTANAFFVQQHEYVTQNDPSAYRPRSHYCGLHGWNNDHNGPECRGGQGQTLHGSDAGCHHARGHGREPQSRGAGRLCSTLPSSFLFPCLLPHLTVVLPVFLHLARHPKCAAVQTPLMRLESEWSIAPLV
jgi:hypothetical protein